MMEHLFWASVLQHRHPSQSVTHMIYITKSSFSLKSCIKKNVQFKNTSTIKEKNIMLFQTCMTDFLLWNTKEDIKNNVMECFSYNKLMNYKSSLQDSWIMYILWGTASTSSALLYHQMKLGQIFGSVGSFMIILLYVVIWNTSFLSLNAPVSIICCCMGKNLQCVLWNVSFVVGGRKKVRSGTTQGWVNDDRILICGLAFPLG